MERINNFDFIFSYLSCNKLTYQDVSEWVSNVKPTSYIIDVTFPGSTTAKSFEFKTDGVNIISSESELGNSDFLFIDGIYCFEVSNYGKKYKRSAANICQLECKLDHLIAQAQVDNIKDYEKITHIRFLLDAVLLNAKLNKPEKALKFLKKASDELSCVKCNC